MSITKAPSKKTKSGNPSTRGKQLPKNHGNMNRAEFIQHTVMLGFSPKQISGFCLEREPKAKKNKEMKRVIEEAIRKQRCLFLQALDKSKALNNEDKALTLDEIEPEEIQYLPTHVEQLNWIFGGGLPKSQLIIVAGDPGVGKTRLAVCISAGLTRDGKKVHYFQGEVKPSIFANWANKQNPVKAHFLVDSSTDIQALKDKVMESQPDLVVIDSVDMFKRSFSSSEARRTIALLRQAAEATNCPFILIHHLNKQGTVKGSNDIEYLCDVVVYARKEALDMVDKEFWVEIPDKNRCGVAGRRAVFHHTEDGIEPVANVTHGSGLKLAKAESA